MLSSCISYFVTVKRMSGLTEMPEFIIKCKNIQQMVFVIQCYFICFKLYINVLFKSIFIQKIRRVDTKQ